MLSRKEFFSAIRRVTGRIETEWMPELNRLADRLGLPQEAASILSVTPEGRRLIQEFEGLHKLLPTGNVQAYPDPASGGDPWTIGYGTTGPDVRPGTIWTRQQCEERFASHVEEFAKDVAQEIGDADTSANEFSAMVSLAYNVGMGNFRKSTLLKKHLLGDKVGAANEFRKWNRAAGKVMAGLTRRREAEAAMYRGG